MICCVGFAPTITLCIQDITFISLPHFFAVLLKCLVANRMHDLEYFYSVQASFFSLSFRLVLWSKYNVIDPSCFFLSQPFNSNCFKVTIDGEIPEWFPSSLATELGRTPVSL